MTKHDLIKLDGRHAPAGVARDRLSRRLFLGGLSGAIVALPMMDSLLPQLAKAQDAVDPKRFICMKSFSTQLIKAWYPRMDGNGYQLKDAVYSGSKADGTTQLTSPLGGGPYTQAPLRDFESPQGISDILGPSLNPYLDKLTLIRGLDFLPSVNHNFGGLLGNFSSCTNATPCDADALMDVPTIDQVLAYSSKFYGQSPAVRSLNISQGVEDAMSYTNLGQNGRQRGANEGAHQPARRLERRFCFPRGQRWRTRPADRIRMPCSWIACLINIENSKPISDCRQTTVSNSTNTCRYSPKLKHRLTGNSSFSCVKPLEPESLVNNSETDPTDIKNKWEAFLDLVVLALSCDRTRIVTLGVHKALGPGPDPMDSTLAGHYHSEDAGGGTWHGLAHDWSNENARRMLAGINAWIAENVFAKLCEKMDGVEESNGATLLDNSLVYWGNELGFNHIGHSVPCLLAGSAGGTLSTGRYLDYIDWDGKAFFSQEDGNVIKGIPHNRFLVSVLQAMGLSPEDYETEGMMGYGSTSTSGRDPALWPVDYDLSQVGKVLPGFFA